MPHVSQALSLATQVLRRACRNENGDDGVHDNVGYCREGVNVGYSQGFWCCGEGMRVALLTVALLLAGIIGLSPQAAPSTVEGVGEPRPLRGTPLRGETNLRLVVADNPPFVLDVDTGETTPLRAVRPQSGGTVLIVGVGGRAAVVVARPTFRRADLYGVRGPSGRVSILGTGTDVVPGDQLSVWVKSFASRSRCSLRQTSLDGQTIRASRAFPCASTIYPAGSLGLVMNRTRVIDPSTGRTRLRTRWGVLAAAGRTLVLSGPTKTFTILHTASGAERRVPWPRTVGGLDAPAVDPRGRFVALAFANPAWNGGPQQALDVWLLDAATARLTQLPGMPALVSLKRTSMAWTGENAIKTFLIVSLGFMPKNCGVQITISAIFPA